MLQFAIIGLTFAAVGLLTMEYLPVLVGKVHSVNVKRAKKFADRMDDMFVRVKASKLVILYLLVPIVMGAVGYFIFHKFIGLLLGVALALVGPSLYVKNMESVRRIKFHKQLIDALLLLSSSLKGGLSLIQAFEVLVDEMPTPISQEFSVVLSENKIGIPLEESLQRLYKRMPSNELNQLITAILLARETGGNLPVIFSRLVNSIRENNRIIKQIQSLTLQGRIQGAIMAALPVVFAIYVFSVTPNFFDIMLASQLGRGLLTYSIFSEAIGIMLIRRISKVVF